MHHFIHNLPFLLIPSHGDQEMGVLFISVFMFQRDGSPVLEKDISWIVELARDWEKIFQTKLATGTNIIK